MRRALAALSLLLVLAVSLTGCRAANRPDPGATTGVAASTPASTLAPTTTSSTSSTLATTTTVPAQQVGFTDQELDELEELLDEIESVVGKTEEILDEELPTAP